MLRNGADSSRLARGRGRRNYAGGAIDILRGRTDRTGFEHRGLTDYARLIRAEVKQATGIPVSIGIGVTKTLAKIANRLAKKTPDSGGVWNLLDVTNHDDHLARVDVGDIWGVGRQWSAWLEQQGIKTALDLKHADAKPRENDRCRRAHRARVERRVLSAARAFARHAEGHHRLALLRATLERQG